MAVVVRALGAPRRVLNDARAFLVSDPVRHNLILTLLDNSVASPEPGRYWIVEVDGRTAGVVFQSPVQFVATVTPMPTEAVVAAVQNIIHDGVELPGVCGEAATAAEFAGHWAEETKSPARPVQGQRIYELQSVISVRAVSGQLRRAGSHDRDLLVAWYSAFHDEAWESVSDLAPVVHRRVPTGELWIWEDEGPAAMAGVSGATAGVVRVGPVYTPPDRRNSGYASALVGAISTAARARGERCILYTDLANPTSNSIYRAIGYRAVVEVLLYRFGQPPNLT